MEQLKNELLIKFAKIQKLINSTFAKGIDQGRESYFNSAVDDALNSAKEKGGNKTWSDDELKSEVEKATNELKKGKNLSNKLKLTLGMLCNFFKNNKKFVVFLGTFKDKTEQANTGLPSCDKVQFDYRFDNVVGTMIPIVFSTENWDNLIEKHHDDMWVVNLFFVELMAALDCDFILIDKPSSYYSRATKTELQIKSYSKELHAIDLLEYNWNEFIPFSRATREGIKG